MGESQEELAIRVRDLVGVKRRIVAELAGDLTRHPVGDIAKHRMEA
ncbi:protein required for attachment to host cells [Bradyrhizobium sp. LB9.1b]